jgi:two-component system chemotaxis response regulator CheB
LPARHVIHSERIRHGQIYCAPADYHLMIEDGYVHAFHGPKENGFRPAIDPLFRTAAAAHSTRVVGVLLSGGLDDGVHGLLQIKRRGGMAIVQNPEQAVVDALPLNAIKYVEVDHIAGAEEIAALIVRLANLPAPAESATMRNNEIIEATVSDGVHDVIDATKPGRAPSGFTCPDCGGALWELQDEKLVRYRCHVGHVYTSDSLVNQKDGVLENVLWTALRALEESAALRHRMAKRAREGNISLIAENFERRAREDEQRAGLLRQFLVAEKESAAADDKPATRGKQRNKSSAAGDKPKRRKTKS